MYENVQYPNQVNLTLHFGTWYIYRGKRLTRVGRKQRRTDNDRPKKSVQFFFYKFRFSWLKIKNDTYWKKLIFSVII